MNKGVELTATEIRKKIDLRDRDGDGHVVETPIVLLDYVKKIAGSEVAARYEKWALGFERGNSKKYFGECPLDQTP